MIKHKMDHIPANTGRFLVGCADFMTAKTFRPRINRENARTPSQEADEPLGPVPGSFMRLFYPTDAEVAKKHERAPWIPKRIYADGFASVVHLPIFFFGRLTNWILGNTKMHAYLDGPLNRAESAEQTHSEENQTKRRLPVIVFSHGLGANRTVYSAFCADLASKGFLVAAVEHRDQSASASYYIDEENKQEVQVTYRRISKEVKADDEFKLRNSQVEQRALEVSMALSLLEMLNNDEHETELSVRNVIESGFDFSTLKGAMNLENVALVGHSFGGATTINSLARDKRFKFGVVYDPWLFPLSKDVYDKVDQPLMLINSETFHWKENAKMIEQLLQQNEKNKRVLTIRGTGHHSQCDIPSIVPVWLLKVLKMHSPLDQEIAMKIQRKLLFSFLKENLDWHESADDYSNETDKDMFDYVMNGIKCGDDDGKIYLAKI